MEIVISLVILFVGIAILVVLHVCIVGRAFRGNNNNHGHDEEHSMSGMKRMFGGDNIGDLKKLPCFEYSEGAERGECAICLENFKVGDVCRLLPNCGHTFHAVCIDSWILQTPFCPICRTRVWLHSQVVIDSSALSLREEQSVVSENIEIETV